MTARFAPGNVVTVFRSRLRANAASGYHETADVLLETAREIPGFLDYKAFYADDGERVSLVTFDGPDAQRTWREHHDHRAAQQRGRAEWYAEYSIQVCSCTDARTFSQ